MFVTFTRPDGSAVSVNSDQVVHIAPVPTSGPLMGPLSSGTRIQFQNGTHQDVKEDVATVTSALNGGS